MVNIFPGTMIEVVESGGPLGGSKMWDVLKNEASKK